MNYRIGMFHYKIGATDGVSLELDKWKRILEAMGHSVFLCAGDLGSAQGTVIEEMFHHRSDAQRLYKNTFVRLTDYADDAAYRKELYGLADKIEQKIRKFIKDKKINFLIPQNIWSVGLNPAVAIAAARVAWDLQIPTLAHNHDFYFERTQGLALTCETAVELADCYLPPRDPLIRHAVINSLAKRDLRRRKGIDAEVVPNVFDFESVEWVKDDYNQDFRAQIGLKENDLLVLQATRIVPRKGIEMAIDFVAALNRPKFREQLQHQLLYNGKQFKKDSRIVLVLAGYSQDDPSGTYLQRLQEKAKEMDVDLLAVEDRVSRERFTKNDQKIYSLWDTYVHADFVTYPSLWEGWGNQLLEAIVAKLPVMIFEYPVFIHDIQSKGFDLVSLGNQIKGTDSRGLSFVADIKIEQAVEHALCFLLDREYREQVVNHNFKVGHQFYSMEALSGSLSALMAKYD